MEHPSSYIDEDKYTKISINLVIISRISKGERIYRGDDNLIVVSKGDWWDAIFRAFTGLSRISSVTLLNEKLMESFIYSRNLMSEQLENNHLPHLKEELLYEL